jgi:PII-like signaling protein
LDRARPPFSGPLYGHRTEDSRFEVRGGLPDAGPMGFGHSSRIHTTKILRLSQDLPIVIEIVDAEDKIIAVLAVSDGMIGSGLLTLEKVKMLRYGNGKPKA